MCYYKLHFPIFIHSVGGDTFFKKNLSHTHIDFRERVSSENSYNI